MGATGATNVIGYIGGGHETLALTTKANGFCPDNLLHASLIADPTKVENACVSLECDGKGECKVIWGPTCPRESTEATTVNLVSECNYGDVSAYGQKTTLLDAQTACIANVYTEDRSGKKAEVAKTEDKADSAGPIKKIKKGSGFSQNQLSKVSKGGE